MEIIDIEKKSKTMRGKRNRISKLSIDHIAIVDSPATPSATFFIWKNLESVDLSDPETLKRLENELESMTDEEKAEVMKALEALDATVTLALMEKDYDKLRKNDPGLCRMLREAPEQINWDLNGFTMKPEYMLKKQRTLSHDKKYFYDFDRTPSTWVPVKKEGR